MAAEAGYANAQFQVGNFYYEGRGNVRHDYAAAVRWLEHAYANRSDRKTYAPQPNWRSATRTVWEPHATTSAPSDYCTKQKRGSTTCGNWWMPRCSTRSASPTLSGRGTKKRIAHGIGYFDRAIEYGSEEAARNRARFEKSFFGLRRLENAVTASLRTI